MLIDLQLHSTYSDGYLDINQLASFLAKQKIKVASLTDHNTVSGLGSFKLACRKYGIKTINGLELYAKLNHKKFNLLWYNFNEDHQDLHKLLRSIQQKRRNRVRKILENINGLGMKININKTIDKHNHYIPVNHLVDDICKNKDNYKKITEDIGVKNPRIEEIIEFLFYNKKRGSSFMLKENYVDINRIIALRKKIGGQLILNHPGKYGKTKRVFVEKLKKLGIDGIEILSPHHSHGAIMYFQSLAKEFNLLETGGSDFHANEGEKFPLQNSWQYFKIDSNNLKGIEKIIK